MPGMTAPVPSRSISQEVPRQRPSVVARPQLLDRLHASFGNGLIIVQAPAGFGKTALLAAFAADVRPHYRVAWLTLDAACSVPEVFADQLAAALTGGDGYLPPAAVGRTGDLKAYLGATVRHVADACDLPLLIVLDNVHEIGSDETTVDLLGWLIESAPAGTEVVLSGRELPPLAGVDERIASGDAAVLGPLDLAFSADEIQALCDRFGMAGESEAVRKATGGWPVGVMAICSGTVSTGGSPRGQQNAAWVRYLNSQVRAAVPEHLQPALLQLSLLPVIDAFEAEARVGSAAWRELSAWLTARDFLYESLDGDRIRLNPMVRAFLRDEYRRTEPQAFDAALGEIIDALAGDGRTADAIELARTPGQEERLASILETSSQRLLHQGAFALLQHGFEAVPPAILRDRPLLAAIRARVQSHLGRAHEALDNANALLENPAVTGPARVHALLAKMRAFRLFGKYPELIELSGRVRALDDCGNDSAILADLTYAEADIALSVCADFTRAERLLRETVQQCDAGGMRLLGLLASSTLGQTLTMKGDAPAAVDILARAAQGWRDVGRSANLGWVLNNLGMAYLNVGDFESAVTVLEEARAEGERCENPRNAAYAIASLADAELALGHWQRAREFYEDAIRICAEDAPDETLAALSISGLAGALLGLGDVQQADFFVKRALLVAVASSNSYELATCKLQEAAVESAAGNHVAAVNCALESVELFGAMDTKTSLCAAYYRLALCQFKAGRRQESQETLHTLQELITDPWMVGALLPLVREQPMFAQWVASRSLAGHAFREAIERHPFATAGSEPAEEAPPPGRFPTVVVKSLGQVSVAVGGREVTEEAWSSSRAKELFFLFLANPAGLRKEEAVELLYPELPREKCNSAFHSNLYRLRKALYQESVIKRDGGYILNPDGTFSWDVERFEAAITEAAGLPAGSKERADAHRQALALYQGPFAEAFFSEWAASIRERLDERSREVLSTLAGFHAGRGEFEEAANCMERILQANRLNEEAAFQFATYRTRAGQTAAALAFIDSYRRSYEQEFGEDVPERFVGLRAQIAAGGGR